MKYYKQYPISNTLLEVDPTSLNNYYLLIDRIELSNVSAIVEYYSKGKISTVTYKVDVRFPNIDYLGDYHIRKYGSVFMVIEYRFDSDKILFTTFDDNKVLNYNYIKLDSLGNTVVSQMLNKNFELDEYQEYYRDSSGEIIKVKIFYPNSWTLHEEEH